MLPSLWMPTPLAAPMNFYTTNPKSPLPSHDSATDVFRASSLPRFVFSVKCSNGSSSQESEVGGLKETLSAMAAKEVDKVMNRNENRNLMKGLEKAAERVGRTKMELAEIEQAEMEAKLARNQVHRLEGRLSEIEECQKEIIKARSLVEQMEQSESFLQEMEEKDEERWESIKAALVSSLIGTLEGLPFSLIQTTLTSQVVLESAINSVCCALFGITFRYTIRRDLDNIMLKTGTAAAFALVKGLSTLIGRWQNLELDAERFVSNASDAAVYVAGNLLIFNFVAVGLEFCFKKGFISPFPVKRP